MKRYKYEILSGVTGTTFQVPIFLEASVDEMGVMVGFDGEFEQIEQFANFTYKSGIDPTPLPPNPTESSCPVNPSVTPSITPSNSIPATPTPTPSVSPTPTPSVTQTPCEVDCTMVMTVVLEECPTPTPTNTPTVTPTSTPSVTPTSTPAGTPPVTPTRTPTGTPTRTPTGTPTQTPTSSTAISTEVYFSGVVSEIPTISASNLVGQTLSITIKYTLEADADVVGLSPGESSGARTRLEVSYNGGSSWATVDEANAGCTVQPGDTDCGDTEYITDTYVANGITSSNISDLKFRSDYDCSSSQVGADGTVSLEILSVAADVGTATVTCNGTSTYNKFFTGCGSSGQLICNI